MLKGEMTVVVGNLDICVILTQGEAREQYWYFSDWKHFLGHFGLMLAMLDCKWRVIPKSLL